MARLDAADPDDWLALRRAPWLDAPPDIHRREIADQLAASRRCVAFTARENMTLDELRALMERHGIRHPPIARGRRRRTHPG